MSTSTVPRAGLDRLAAVLDGSLARPGDPDWDAARQAGQRAVDQRPTAAVRAGSIRDVVAVVDATDSDHVTEGQRRAALPQAGSSAAHPGIGLLVLDADGSVAAADTAGESWLEELREDDPGGRIPMALTAVAVQARRIAAGRATAATAARCRLRTASGYWLVLHATTLGEGPDATTAVIVEPATSREVAPLLADAYGLSEQERVVSRLVARGVPTDAIARELHLSRWTVQDHLKAIFAKVGVSSRGELVARLYLSDGPADLTG